MKIIITLLILVSSMQFASAFFRYYNGQSAAFVLINERRIEDLADGSATLRTAMKPPAFWTGIIGTPWIHVTDFPIAHLTILKEIDEPSFLVFYSNRATLTDKKAEADGTMLLSGDMNYQVGILTATKLFSLTEESINLQDDTIEWIEAYRKYIQHEDPKERDLYLFSWDRD